ncbi:hypothetical protein [Chryseobacterium sp. FH1]|uniref:hypothetical protein n=1 Tax=Chryseobacterium sp. FH1 TaxID=1233951 RepID=UPI0004E29B00|nr:hypothetical protein [Chryseobacterium sp. FH1]KFC20633.1 hypothetical protein IO90_15965 [Chryseobacterium sp. FH1]
MKKSGIVVIVILVLVLLFVDRCTTINLTTADIFRPSTYDDFKELPKRPQSKNYEIVPAKGTFPILYNPSSNEFYLRNGQGLTKYDALGNVMISNDLKAEEFTSVFDFLNFVPYVFAKNGVYDYSGKRLIYNKFSKIVNSENELNDKDFKSIFETNYRNADLVIYDNNRNVKRKRECFPMYFKIKDDWILMFSQKGDYRFSHQQNGEIENDTIGQVDFIGFPAKFSRQRLTVLKDAENGIFSISQLGMEAISDKYLDTYYTQILKERKEDYRTDDKFKLLSYKKDEYYSSGNFFNLPSWVAPSFMLTGFFRLTYQNENLYFTEKALKLNGDGKVKNDLSIYELPKKFRTKSKVAFLLYSLNVGGYTNDSTNVVEPIIKNAGLYLVKPKRK